MLLTKRLVPAAIFAAFWLLSGCVSAPPTPAEAGFSIRGKIGVVEGADSWSARFVWRQSGERFEIDLWGPLGQGQTRLRGTPHRLEVMDADGGVRTSGSLEALMLAELGWSLPLGLLIDWLRGRPSPQAPTADAVRDRMGSLKEFRQLGWQVSFERASRAPADAPPRRITAQRPGYRVRVAVWERGA